MKICFVTIDFHSARGGGGIGSYLFTIANALLVAGHDITIICGRKKEEFEYEKLGEIKVHRVFMGNIHYYLSMLPVLKSILPLPVREIEWSYAIWKKVRALNDQETFDIIESGETGNLISVLFPHKTPWVIRAHGATYSFKKYSGEGVGISEKLDRSFQRYCMKRASSLSAPSEFQAGEINKEIGIAYPIVVVPNPVDPRFIGKEPPNLPEDRTARKKIILYTGRIDIGKGILVLLRAMARVVKQYENVDLVIAGGRHITISAGMLAKVIDSNELRGHVKVLGHIPWQEIKSLYDCCDIFAIPSYYETFCISAVEAMACNKPVIGASGTALAEIVDHGKTGLLVPPGNDTALADALLKLLREEELAKSMGKEGRKTVVDRFSAESVAAKIVAYYERTCIKWTYLRGHG